MTFITEVKKFNMLTKSEVLTMINEPPSLALHIQLIVEDSEERLTDTQVEELIELSKKHLMTSWTHSTHSVLLQMKLFPLNLT